MAKRKYVLLTPSGYFAVYVVAEAVKYCFVNEFGVFGSAPEVDDWQLGDVPDFELIMTDSGQSIVVDAEERGEWLVEHCRPIDVDDEFEPEDYQGKIISPWPDEIVGYCRQVKRLHEVVRYVNMAKDIAPQGFCDTTTATVLDAVVIGRCDAEIAALQARIDEYRKTDPRVMFPDEENADAEA